MAKRYRRMMILCSVLSVMVITYSVQSLLFGETPSPADSFYNQAKLFVDTMTIVQSEHVKEVTKEELLYGALEGMLSSLDPHSQFMRPRIYEEMQTETKGEFGGLGIRIGIKDGMLTVIAPIDDTPADKAGIKGGDRILKIDGKSTKGINVFDAVQKLRGEKGTQVKITVWRKGEEKFRDITITRDTIPLESVTKALLVEDKIGYIRLTEFREKSPEELDEALAKLDAEGMAGLILDLRNNPGGLLSSAVEISEKFLKKGQLIVTTQGRNPDQKMVYNASSEGKFTAIPIVVMVNEFSASASEIMAGAVKDTGRGIVLGKRTFGKGSVQTIIPLDSIDTAGAEKGRPALRLTTAEYFTPSGRKIASTDDYPGGVEPDLEIEYAEETDKTPDEEEAGEEVFEKLDKEIRDDGEEHPLPEEGEEDVKDKVKMDNQLRSAINAIKVMTWASAR